MKSTVVLLAVGLAACGFTNSASAFKLSPPSTKFTGAGPTSATLNGITLACAGKFKGSTTKAGVGKIASGSFTGAIGCTSVTLGNLPWTAKILTATTGQIPNVQFNSPIGNCGPATLPVSLNSSGVISFNAPFGACSNVTGTIQTTPHVTVVP